MQQYDEMLQRATRDDAVALARRRFLAGERVDMGSIAGELGVNRVTLYRWVGTKELLLGEVIGALATRTVAGARASTPGRGADHVAAVVGRSAEQIHAFEPIRAFLRRDGEYALRVLTSAHSTVQRQSIAAVRRLLADEVPETGQDLDDLAYVIIRIGESFLYADLIVGAEPHVDRVEGIVRRLLR
jgi:hypothetical protein